MERAISPRSSKRLRSEPRGEAKKQGTCVDNGDKSEKIVDAAQEGLRELCNAAGVDDSHGVTHALKASGVSGAAGWG